jgi:hypothetical protein
VQQWNDTATGASMLRLHMLSGEPHAIKSIQPGDILQFLNRTSGELLSERSVLSVSIDPIGRETMHGSTRGQASGSHESRAVAAPTVVVLDGWPGALDLGVVTGNDVTCATNIYNLNVTATQFVFRANNVTSGRRFGVLAKGQRLCIESNRFIGLGGGAVRPCLVLSFSSSSSSSCLVLSSSSSSSSCFVLSSSSSSSSCLVLSSSSSSSSSFVLSVHFTFIFCRCSHMVYVGKGSELLCWNGVFCV